MMTLTTGQVRKKNSGFTLLELILLMLTVSTVLALVTPQLRFFLLGRTVKHVAAHLISLTGYARTQAITEGRIYQLHIDERKGQFYLAAQEEGIFQNLKNDFGRIFILPEGIKVEWLDWMENPLLTAVPGLWLPGYTERQREETEGLFTISFYPDGRTEPAKLRLSDKWGQEVIIVCETPAEYFHVEEKNVPEEKS